MSTDARISKSRKPMIVVAALLGAGSGGWERPLASVLAPSARLELWRFVRSRVNPGAGALCTNPRKGRIERGTLEEEIRRATFLLSAGRDERSFYDVPQRLSEKKSTTLRNGLDNSSVLFSEH